MCDCFTITIILLLALPVVIDEYLRYRFQDCSKQPGEWSPLNTCGNFITRFIPPPRTTQLSRGMRRQLEATLGKEKWPIENEI